MYKYIYIEATSKNMLKQANHRELIESYSKNGWRFVSAIPTNFDPTFGSPTKFDLVFEKESNKFLIFYIIIRFWKSLILFRLF